MRVYANTNLREREYVKLDKLDNQLFKALENNEKVGCWMNLNYIDKISDYANTLCARDWRGFGRGFGIMTGIIEVENGHK